MNLGHFDADRAYRELRERYNLAFVDLLLERGYTTYLYGGSLRDMVLGKEWKDADIRAWIPMPANERDRKMEEILGEANIEIKSKIIFNDKFTIYRFLPAGSKAKGVIDFTVVTNQFEVIPDFVMNGLYFDIGKKELVDPHNALEDLEKKIIRTVLPPEEQFTLEPHMMYRAIKCACQFDFKIEDGNLEAMKKLAHLTEGTLTTVVDNVFPGMTEWFIGNIFRGLKYNPYVFVNLWNESGLSQVFIEFVGKGLSIEPKSLDVSQPFEEGKEYEYETAISMFISSVARALYREEADSVFGKIVKLFRLTTPSEFGDFVVDASKLVYVE